MIAQSLSACISVGVVLAASGSALAATSILSPVYIDRNVHTPAGVAVGVDAGVYATLRTLPANTGERFTLEQFPLRRDALVNLEVERFDVFTPETKFVNNDQPAEAPDVVLLRGSVVGDPLSRVFLSFSPFGNNGYIEVGGKMYMLSSGPFGQNLPTVVFDVDELPDAAIVGPGCGGGLVPPSIKQITPWAPVGDNTDLGGGVGTASTSCYTIAVAVDTDFEYTSRTFGGNATASRAYVATLFGAISEIYTRDVNTRVTIPFVRTFTTDTDPYSGTSGGGRLNQFRNHWNANFTNQPRQLAHLLSRAQTDVGGVAWLGTVCSSISSGFGYAFSDYMGGSFPTPLRDNDGRNWDVMVVAHEQGHNFNAPHTHDMVPQIDGCGTGNCSGANQGTIMSYCHTCAGGMGNIRLNLQTRIINERINPYLEGLTCNIRSIGLNLVTQPAPVSVEVGSNASFSVQHTGSGPVTYQWQRNGLSIPNTNVRVLNLTNVQQTQAGRYRVIVTNPCGSVTSNEALLTVRVCRVEFNGDGVVDINDFFAFLTAYAANDPRADMNNTGQVDINDFFGFLTSYAAGC